MHRSLAVTFVVMLAALVRAESARPAPTAQTAPASDATLQRASELFDSGKYVDAMPLFEQLSADRPQDAAIKGR